MSAEGGLTTTGYIQHHLTNLCVGNCDPVTHQPAGFWSFHLYTLLVSGIVVNALATGMYIGAGFGAGPRDGLMTGIHARLGWSIRSVRTAIEVTVLIVGYLLGGAFGVGTVLYALTIGPLIQLCLPWFRQRPRIQKAARPERIV